MSRVACDRGDEKAGRQTAAWASGVAGYSPSPGVGAGFSNSASAIGSPNGDTVSLGDPTADQIAQSVAPGRITLTFASQFENGPGWDLAVFENAGAFFDPPFVYAELGYVEVSSNGQDFARFPSVSLNVEPGQGVPGDTEIVTPFGRNFAGINPTNVHNLAGIHPTNVGTVFDLADLTSLPAVQSGAVNLSDIRFVRIVDIPGNGAFLDSEGRPILDTWLSTGSGGVDLDAVGVRYAVPEPGSMTLLTIAGVVAAITRRRRRRFMSRQP